MAPTPAAIRILLAGALLAGAASSTAAPRVVVSLAPLHSLVAGVMAGIATPELVVRGAGSPHTYALRPSDAARLAQADLVVWVGEPLEIFLVRPLAALAPGTARLRLLGLDGLVLHPSRPGGAHHDEHHDEPGPAAGGVDPHLWLDPRNAIVVVRAAAARLADLDAANAPAYAANARAVEDRIRALDAALERRLAPLRSVPFVVFHDAFQYFERRYDLKGAGAVTLSPERLPGARRVIALRERIRALGARCVFREPQFPSPLLATILEETGAREGVIDPLGSAVAPGPDAWFETLERLAEGFESCLGGG